MLETQRKFAKRHGVASSTVAEWKNRGHLVMVGNLVDVEATNARLAERPAKYRGGVASQPPGSVSDPEPVPAPTHAHSTDWSLVEAQRRKEIFLAKKRELEYNIAAGKLINAVDAESVMRSDYALTAKLLLQIPSKVAPRIVAMTTAAEVEALLHKEFVRALNGLAEAAGEDLRKIETNG